MIPQADLPTEAEQFVEETIDRRQFKRWEVSIPCTVRWGVWVVQGQIANLSFDGALIVQVNAVPPKDAVVLVTFQVTQEEVILKGKLISRIIHSAWEIIEGMDVGSFGVKFEDPLESIKSKLDPLFRTFSSAGGTSIGAWDSHLLFFATY